MSFYKVSLCYLLYKLQIASAEAILFDGNSYVKKVYMVSDAI